MSSSPFPPDSAVHLLFDPASDHQSDAADALAARWPGVVRLGRSPQGAQPSDSGQATQVVCLDADLFDDLPASWREAAWYAPLAWHRDALAIPNQPPQRALVLTETLAEAFPNAETVAIPYPLPLTVNRRSDRESARQRLGVSPGRLAVFCREESSPLMRVMKALEYDDRIMVMTLEEPIEERGDSERWRESMLLGASDLFLAESSPRAVAESLAYGVPMAALVREEGDANARLLSDAGAGVVATRPGDMLMLVDGLAASYPGEIQRLRRALEQLRAGLPAINAQPRAGVLGS